MDYLNLLALDSFLNTVLLPVLSRCSRQQGRGEHDANSARLVLFESVAWLSVGVEFGIFPADASQALCKQYFPALNEQYRLFPEEFLYIVQEELRDRIQSVFEKGVLTEKVSPNENTDRGNVAGRLEIVLDLVGKVNRDQSIRSMCTSILLLNGTAWKKLGDHVPSDAVFASLSGDHDVWTDGNRGFVFAGVFRVIDHLEALLDLLEYQRRPTSINFAAWGLFRETVYSVHRWRFDLQDETYYEKFAALASTAVRALNSDPEHDVGTVANAFHFYLQDLRKRWKALQGLVASASS